MRRGILSIVLALVSAILSRAQDLPKSNRPAPTANELVLLLVSANKPVNPKRESFAEFPKSYNREAQRVVREARAHLLKLGFDAIPELIDHLQDKRYCLTASYSLLVDKTVGDVCFDLLDEITSPKIGPDFEALPESQLENIKGNPTRLGKDGKWDYVGLSYLSLLIHRDKSFTRETINKWWQKFADKSIDDIHLAAVRRLIAHEEAVGFQPESNREQYLKPYRDHEKKLMLRLRKE